MIGEVNPNIYVFEVGICTVDPITKREILTPCTIHPLLVAPNSVGYSDNSRSSVTQTTGGAILTVSGRALRSVNLSGSFGVMDRGLLGYLGTGDLRFKRFYNEVIRMPEALRAGDVEAATDILSGTPFISLLTLPFNEQNSTFYINFYDFWNNRAFQVNIQNWTDSRQARGGGASGLVQYTMRLQEVGPIKQGSPATAVLAALMAVLGTWNTLNEVIKSYTVSAVLESFLGAGAIVLGELADSLDAVGEQVDSVSRLMGAGGAGGVSPAAVGDGVGAFFGNVRRLIQAATDVRDSVTRVAGALDMDPPRGQNDPRRDGPAALGTFEALVGLGDLLDAAHFQNHAGAFFGMSAEDYQLWIDGGGYLGGQAPQSGTNSHRVGPHEDGAVIAELYGVAWGDVLAVNGLTPDEALIEGTELLIPSSRKLGPPGLAGVPTFGSHLGADIWGRDLPVEIEVDPATGDLAIVSGAPVLAQGALVLAEGEGERWIKLLDRIPTEKAQASFLQSKFVSLLATDPRFTGIRGEVQLTPSGSGYSLSASVKAINGGIASLSGAEIV